MSISVTIKTLDKKQFGVDLQPDQTIGAVKDHLTSVLPSSPPASWQRLIHKGKVLTDDSTVAAAGIAAGEFVIVMVRKPKGAKPAAKAAEATKAAEAGDDMDTAAAASASAAPESAPAPESTASASSASSASSSSAESTLVSGGEMTATVERICELGFPRDQVEAALRASFGNPDRAVEYLMSGQIPSVPGAAAASAAAPTATGAATGAGAAAPAGTGTAASAAAAQPASGNLFTMGAQLAQEESAQAQQQSSGVFDVIRQHPHFNQLRMLVQQNPALLQPVLAQLGQQDPQLLQLINQNQEEFIRMLNEPVDAAALEQMQRDMQANGGPGGGPGGPGAGGPGGAPPGVQYVSVTPEEKEAIERLAALGFPVQMALEAYMACDKNEEFAANWLLEYGFEDNDMDAAGDIDQAMNLSAAEAAAADSANADGGSDGGDGDNASADGAAGDDGADGDAPAAPKE